MRGEQDLIRTLRTAAEQVERIDLAEAVAARRRSRRTRQRSRTLLAAAAVVAIVAGTTFALSGGQERRPQPAVTPSAPASITPAGKLWPQAIAKVPATNSTGWKMYPVTALSPTEVLLIANSAFEKAGRLEVYDMARKKTRVLGDIPSPRKKYYLQHIAVSSRYIAWYGETPQDPDKWADFWIMPRAGGTPKRLAEVAADVDRIGLTDDALVWSLKAGGGVYRMPLTGGSPSPLPGTKGLRLMSWPWAGGFASERPDANQTRVVNLETGRSADVSLPDQVEMMQCHAEWCTGIVDSRMVVQRVDGSARKTLPFELRPHGARWLLGDRYALFQVYEPDREKKGVPLGAVYDLATGVTAGLGERSGAPLGGNVGMGGSSSSPSLTPFWDADLQYYEKCGSGGCEIKGRGGGKEYTVVNLAAVTR
ncbi:hypothetical protein [Nonomuraea sp. SYSU D8015]|uniref:hypothetical protein n=1 Tax=Nonomuraea sp. SYSU D8015 TaxID=2593644 RepID=UPI00166061AF|nr:hypothetical protein [Nonomuraea sp. SYSU D8015]